MFSTKLGSMSLSMLNNPFKSRKNRSDPRIRNDAFYYGSTVWFGTWETSIRDNARRYLYFRRINGHLPLGYPFPTPKRHVSGPILRLATITQLRLSLLESGPEAKPSRRFPRAIALVPGQSRWAGAWINRCGGCRVGTRVLGSRGTVNAVSRRGLRRYRGPCARLNIGIPVSSLLSQGRRSSKQKRLPVSTSALIITGSAGSAAPGLGLARATSPGIPTPSIRSTRRVRLCKSLARPTCAYISNGRVPGTGSCCRPGFGVARTR